MGMIIPEQLLLGIVVWLVLALLTGMVVSWIWVLRRLLAGEPLLPERPLIERRPIPWGGGTVLLMFVSYIIGNVLAFEGYALATRGSAAARQAARATMVAGADAQRSESGKADQGPTGAPSEGTPPRSKEPTGSRTAPAPSTEAATDPGRLSVTEMMCVQTAISVVLVVLLPLLVRASSGARLRDLGLSLHEWNRQVAVGVVGVLIAAPLVYGIQLVVVNLFHVPPQPHPVEKMLRDRSSVGVAYLAILAAVIVAPLLEELMFRSLFQSWMVKLLVQLVRRWRAIALRAPDPRLTPVIPTLPVDELDYRSSPLPDTIDPPQLHSGAADDPEFTAKDLKAPRKEGTGVLAGIAIVATSLFFAAVHGPQWPAPIALFVLSLAIGTVFQRTGSLIAAICMHAIFNGFSMLGLLIVLLGGAANDAEKAIPPPAVERSAPAQRPHALTVRIHRSAD